MYTVALPKQRAAAASLPPIAPCLYQNEQCIHLRVACCLGPICNLPSWFQASYQVCLGACHWAEFISNNVLTEAWCSCICSLYSLCQVLRYGTSCITGHAPLGRARDELGLGLRVLEVWVLNGIF